MRIPLESIAFTELDLVLELVLRENSLSVCFIVCSTLERCTQFHQDSEGYLQKLASYLHRLTFANSRMELLQGTS